MSILTRFGNRITGRRASAGLRPVARLEDFIYNDAPKVDRIIFICGLHRSGTTLLERLLAARFRLSYLRASVPESEGQHMQSVYRPASDYGGPGHFAFSRAMRNDLESLGKAEICRERIITDWSHFVVGESATQLEKSPPNLTKIDWLRRVFPESLFVIMTRDPRAVSAATQKWSQTSLPELMMHWNVAYSLAVEDFRKEDCTVIRYEDLIQTPEAEIGRLAEFLRLVPRVVTETLEGRHNHLQDFNTRYFKMHEDFRYGKGIWNHFGYEA